MNDFLTWLSSNPVSSSIVASTVAIIILVVALLYIVAFFQGRDISFWPPKIGQNESIASKSPLIKLEDRSEYEFTLEKRLAQAKTVSMCGSSLVGVLSHYKGFIQMKAKTGCKFRFLVTHPDCYPSSGKRSTEAKAEIFNALKLLDELSENENIKYRVLSFHPQFSVMIIDASTPESEIQVEMYPYQAIASERPHFWVSKKNNNKWHSFFSEQFETAWQNAKEYRTEKGS